MRAWVGWASGRGSFCSPGARLRSNRQRDLPNKACENEQPAQAMALALIRQEEASEADQNGERHSDLASRVHVLFPQRFQPMSLALHDRSQSLPEAFVVRETRLGEKQEQSKNKNGSLGNFLSSALPRGREWLEALGVARRCGLLGKKMPRAGH